MYLSEVNEEWRQRIGNVKYLVWKTVNPNVNYLTPNNPSLTRKKFLEVTHETRSSAFVALLTAFDLRPGFAFLCVYSLMRIVLSDYS